MGSCLCKEKTADVGATDNSCPASDIMADSSESSPKRARIMDPEMVDRLVKQMLNYISSYQAGGDEAPPPLLQLNRLADSREGWISVVEALVRTVPLESPLGASTITIIFDDCPLPARETVLEFTRHLNLNRERAIVACESAETIRRERNVLVLLTCIAEKFGGTQCAQMLNEDLLNYLTTFFVKKENPILVIHALIALEKLGHSKMNKIIIDKFLEKQVFHPLLALDQYYGSENYLWKEVGFCARWALDNTYTLQGRPYSYETQDMSKINCILDTKGISECLKISSDGLEARCDLHSFENVRATFRIDSGCWYYEVEIVTPGVMQIGWASQESTFQSHEGFGVGDDVFSLAYDGCRRLIWHRAVALPEMEVYEWSSGDILGCLIDVDQKETIFSLNGRCIPVNSDLFKETSEGFYPAASFMAHQQCRFNFGATPFRYPPKDRPFQVINDHGILSAEEKKVVPRRIILENLRLEEGIEGQLCTVCYNAEGNFGVYPCEHSGFCHSCVIKLDTCPLCRRNVEKPYILML